MSDRTVSVLRTHDDRLIPVAGVYDIDGAHTSVEFVGRHLMITKVRGRFNDVRGRITIGEEPEKSHVEVEIGVASLSSGNDDRDAHLKSEDFFDVEHYPTIAFASTAVRPLRDNTWELVGRSDRARHHQAHHPASRLRWWRRLPDGRRAHRLQRGDRRQPRGLRAHLERGARDRRAPRRQDGVRIELAVQAIAATKAAVA